MPVEILKDKWPGSVREVTFGATPAEGGTRARSITVGGEKSMPFMHFEAPMPHRPVVGLEIRDRRPDDWSPLLLQEWSQVIDDPLVLRLLRVFLPLANLPHGERGCPPPELRPSPPPITWSIGFMATPRTVGRMPSQRLRPALPRTTLAQSALPSWPIVARQRTWILRISPEGRSTSA